MSDSDNYNKAIRYVDTSRGVLSGESLESAADRRRSDLAAAQVFATLAVADAVCQLTTVLYRKEQS